MTIAFIAANIIVFVAYFVRSVTGFGSSLICIPLLALYFDLKFIVPVDSAFVVVTSLILVPKVIKKVNQVDFALLLGGSLVGSLVGVYILKSFSNDALKILLGIVIIILALNLLRENSRTIRNLSRNWGIGAGTIGGILGGMFGTSGPPYVAYLAYRGLPKEVFRATLIVFFAVEYSWRLGLYVHQGLFTMEGVQFALALCPALVIGTIAGNRAHIKVNDRIFKITITILLLFSGFLCFF